MSFIFTVTHTNRLHHVASGTRNTFSHTDPNLSAITARHPQYIHSHTHPFPPHPLLRSHLINRAAPNQFLSLALPRNIFSTSRCAYTPPFYAKNPPTHLPPPPPHPTQMNAAPGEQTPLRGHIVTDASACSSTIAASDTSHNASTSTAAHGDAMDDTRRILLKIGIDFAVLFCSEYNGGGTCVCFSFA